MSHLFAKMAFAFVLSAGGVMYAQNRTVECDAANIDATIFAPERREPDYKSLDPGGCIAIAPERPKAAGVVPANSSSQTAQICAQRA